MSDLGQSEASGLGLPDLPDFKTVRWRVGRKVGRTIYVQLGREPADDDPLIGVMDTRDLALDAVSAHNIRLSLQGG